MEQFFLPLIFLVFIPLTLWSLFEQRRFHRVEGPLKRGVTVWTDPLSWEARDFLNSLLETKWYGKNFIRVEGREALIGQERSGWDSFSRRNQWPYIAYVNLSEPENRIQFRMPWSTLLSTLLSLVVFTGFFLFLGGSVGGEVLFSCFALVPLFFLFLFLGSIWFNHRRRRRELLAVLDQALAERR